MKRVELEAMSQLTDDELEPLVSVSRHLMENLQLQRDDAIEQQAAAIATATGPLIARIAELQAKISGIQGSYRVVTSPIQEAALVLEAATNPNSTLAGIIAESVDKVLYELARKHEAGMFGAAMQAAATMPEEKRFDLLTILTLQEFSILPLPSLLKVLEDKALPAFHALPQAVREQLIGSLNLKPE